MKKLLGYLLAALFLVMPVVTFAAQKIDLNDYKTMGLKETVENEGLEFASPDYKETDNQVVIYLFRGEGCGYCNAFIKFANELSKTYGEKFKLVSFEVWQNTDNADLLGAVSSFLEQDAGGVPYIVIGDQVFPGYADSYDDGIKQAIDKLYAQKVSDRYDVFEEYNKKLVEDERAERSAAAKPIVWNFIFIAIATIVIVCSVNGAKKAVLAEVKAQAKKEEKPSKKK